MNDIMSFGFHRLWKKELVELLNPTQESLILDLAAGSGDITKLIKKKIMTASLMMKILIC